MTVATTLESLLSEQQFAVVDGARRISDVATRSARVAGGLHEQGVRAGDSVAFQLENVVETIVLYRACWRLGARAVALHHRFGIAERDALLGLVNPAVTITTAAEVTELGANRSAYPTIDARPDHDAVVLFTAGSTGEPKGVRHTHGALVYKTVLMTQVHGLTSADVVLMPAPLAHISGLLNGVLVSGAAGMTTVLMQRWSPAVALDLIARERVSYMVGPPTFFVDLMDDPSFESSRVGSLRLVSSGGAGVARQFVDRASTALGAVVKRSYGSTEAPTVATSLSSDDPASAAAFDGRAIGEAELKVVDGELWVRGPELFAGYLSARQTEAVMAEGWFRTGDLATLTDDGWLTITGRVKEIIIRAGENIAIREVEDVLERHPHVTRAAVVGIAHDRLGEQVAAVVTTDGDAVTLAECQRWFRQCGMARFKTPEVVRTVDELPMLPTGKLDREQVREIIRSRL